MFVRKLRRRLIAWLARALAEETQAQRGAAACTLAPGAVLCAEGEINNFSGAVDDIRVGPRSYVRGRLLTYGHGGKIRIGSWCYIGVRTEIWSMASVTIGDRVLIAHDVNIHDGSAHSVDATQRHAHFRHIIERGHPTSGDDLPGVSSAPVVIEDDVWISFGVTVLRGVRIGRGSVIAAGSIVTCDVPPDTLYRGEVTPVMTPLSGIADRGVRPTPITPEG